MSANAEIKSHYETIRACLIGSNVNSNKQRNAALVALDRLVEIVDAAEVARTNSSPQPPLWVEGMLKELIEIKSIVKMPVRDRLTYSSVAASPPDVESSPPSSLTEPANPVLPTVIATSEAPTKISAPRRRKARKTARTVIATLAPPAAMPSTSTSRLPLPTSASATASAAVSTPAMASKRPRMSRPFVFVRGAGAPNPELMVAKKMKHIHLFYLAKGTSVEQVLKYIRMCYADADVEAELLLTRGDYASFKLRVPEELFDPLMDPQFWPTGAAVNGWRFRRAAAPSL